MSKSTDKSKKIYLDNAASAMPNPSSIHSLGVEAKVKLNNARRIVADVLYARPSEIIFTSGGTESNNLAIQGIIYAKAEKVFRRSSEKSRRPFKKPFLLPHIVTTNIEHPSVLETCKLLERRGLAEISIVSVESNGIVDSKKIKESIKKNTVLVSVMYANNEIGTIQPIKEIAKEIRHWNKINSNKIIFHTDATQAVNYLDLNVERLGVDLLSLSGSKIENSGRVGVLYKRKNVKLENIFGGGDQEQGLRPGTENLEEIIKFSSALASTQKEKDKESKRLTKLRDYFVDQLSKIFFFSGFPATHRQPFKKVNFTELVLNGDLKERLPNNVNVTFPKIPSDLLVIELSAKGIMASSKSACKSGSAEGSYVIKALHNKIGLPAGALVEEGGVRFSLGKSTTRQDIDYTIKSLSKILQKLKKWYD